jgi:hypothetical protein
MAKTPAILALLMALAIAPNLHSTTRTLKRGPACKVEKDVDQHLFQLYVKPHDATPDYSPGKIRVLLRREYPDYMYVALEQETLKDGTLHVQVAISPEKEETYTINVLDEQKDDTLLLYSEKLRDIPVRKKP